MNAHRVNAHRLIHQVSGVVEWYTPSPIVDAARRVMGGIDLDPASSEVANETVGASRIFTVDDDGLAQEWYGRVWLNPPFSDTARYIAKLVAEYEARRVREACVITFASMDTEWARLLLRYPRWYPAGRVAYVAGWETRLATQALLPGLAGEVTADPRLMSQAADAPPKASMVTYLGPADATDYFAAEYIERLGGTVDVPWSWHKDRLVEQTRDFVAGAARWRAA